MRVGSGKTEKNQKRYGSFGKGKIHFIAWI
jgi:hypothetical protein